MIPEPVSIMPLTLILGAVFLGCLYAAGRALRAARMIEPPAAILDGDGEAVVDAEMASLAVRSRRFSYGVSIAGGVMALGTLVMMVSFSTGHADRYNDAVWGVLASEYGIAPVHPGGFNPGEQFPASLDGSPAMCSAAPPATVLCDGEMIVAGSIAGAAK